LGNLGLLYEKRSKGKAKPSGKKRNAFASGYGRTKRKRGKSVGNERGEKGAYLSRGHRGGGVGPLLRQDAKSWHEKEGKSVIDYTPSKNFSTTGETYSPGTREEVFSSKFWGGGVVMR